MWYMPFLQQQLLEKLQDDKACNMILAQKVKIAFELVTVEPTCRYVDLSGDHHLLRWPVLSPFARN